MNHFKFVIYRFTLYVSLSFPLVVVQSLMNW